jgi:hypothetical protein
MPKGIPGRPPCSIEGCDHKHEAHDLCLMHYQRLLRHGDPLGGGAFRTVHSGTVEQRFWAKVNKDGPVPKHPELGPCWVWGAALERGYGAFGIGKRKVVAHRFAYELLVGAIPRSLTLDHLCRVRCCVNPAHLEPVTSVENVRRGESVSALNAVKTHCLRGHEFTVENTRIEPGGRRRCRACHRIQQREERARKAAL